jgi:two-component system chemotaxis response regulator CheB
MIRILVAAGLGATYELILRMLEPDPLLAVVREARDGVQVVSMTQRLQPSLIIMDSNMLCLGGVDAIRRIMIETPTPIVIASDRSDTVQHDIEMRALAAGALTVVRSPRSHQSPDFEAMSLDMISAVRAMAPIKLVRRWPDRPSWETQRASPSVSSVAFPSLRTVRCRVVAVAASTGGPAALQRLLRGLPADFPSPILVVQHIAGGFTNSLVGWLNAGSSLHVKIAEHGEATIPGTVYVAPDDRHLGISDRSEILLSNAPRIRGFRPSASFLFDSVATAFGAATVSVVLTGMGDDGVAGLETVRSVGGFTIAQDEASSVVFGMPGSAITAGLADVVSPVSDIGARLVQLATAGGAE